MITPAVFDYWLGVLEEHYGKSLLTVVKNVYRNYLNKLMNDELFIEACTQILQTDRFFPTAEAIAAKVLQTNEEVAAEDWQQILEQCTQGSIHSLSDAAREALRIAGGFRALCCANTVQQFTMAKKFFDHYGANCPGISDKPKKQYAYTTTRKQIASHTVGAIVGGDQSVPF